MLEKIERMDACCPSLGTEVPIRRSHILIMYTLRGEPGSEALTLCSYQDNQTNRLCPEAL
jgi:hypothetical protein